MAIKPTGSPLSMTEIAAEFGGTAPYSLSQYYRGGGRVPNGPSANANIAASGAISMGGFYSSVNELILTIAANTTNYNLYNAFVATYGTPSGAVPVRLIINSGVTVGGVGATALTIGQFPTGSIINIDNSGSIQGFGGSAGTGGAGGQGGDAINANFPNQTVVINNQAGATIYGGGGGGGAGGVGGQGSYTTQTSLGFGACVTTTTCSLQGPNKTCTDKYGAGAYCVGGCVHMAGAGCLVGQYSCRYCYRDTTTYTSGGSGGYGGIGQGYNQSAATGAGGAAGGTNAGTGGSGGNGGGWGVTGGTGNTGASGNYTGGSAGYSGGSAGRYLVKGSNSVTLNNSGTVAGGLA